MGMTRHFRDGFYLQNSTKIYYFNLLLSTLKLQNFHKNHTLGISTCMTVQNRNFPVCKNSMANLALPFYLSCTDGGSGVQHSLIP